jgi:hypothetical protein
MKLFTISSSTLLGLPLSVLAQQAEVPSAQAKVADCVRDIKGDSVALYFNERYELTPVACAIYCRYTHLGPKGSLYGEVRDYRLATQQLAYRQHYAQGVRQGDYEAYYPNGKLQMRGTYTHGEPSGEWHFWYASGKPWQVLRWNGGGAQPWRFVAYWDSTGQQLLTNGTGHWRDINPQQHRRIEGQVLNELPDGEWQVYHVDLDPTKPLGTETFERGVFKKGHSIAQMGNFTYRDQPRLVPTFDDPSAQGEFYKRGITCEERAQQQAASDAISQRLREQRNLMARVKDLQQPHPAGSAENYLNELLRKLSDAPSMKALLFNPLYTASIEADVDEFGKLSNFRSAAADVQRVFTQVLPPLGRWNSAAVNGKPVRSTVKFQLQVVDSQWRIHYQSNVPDVSKAILTL